MLALLNISTKKMRHDLLAVADAEDGGAGGEQRGIDGGAAGIVNAGGSAGDDDSFSSGERGDGSFTGGDFGVDSEVANFAGDEMAVLSSGIEDGDLRGQILF